MNMEQAIEAAVALFDDATKAIDALIFALEQDEEAIMDAAGEADDKMTTLVGFLNDNGGEFGEQVINLAKAGSHTLAAANDEGGTAEMARLAANALYIAKALI